MFNRLLFVGLVLTSLRPAVLAQQPCESLKDLKLPHTAITSSMMIPEGPFSAFTAPGGPANPPAVPSGRQRWLGGDHPLWVYDGCAPSRLRGCRH
jgi:hypothetical protein